MRAFRHFAISVLACTAAHGAGAPITPEQHEFFENKIRPVLVAECTECHNATKHKGGLRLDYRGGWEKGGDTGDAIVPGDLSKSLLITSIRHEDPDLKMPAKAPKLDDKVIADFEKWVAMGAPDPRDQPPAEQGGKASWPDLLASRRDWWSLLPVQNPPIPEVKNAGWSQHPVDRFLLSKMEEHRLTPAAPAGPRTFIRRLTFALTGLPPSPAEVEAFVADSIRDPQSAIRNATDRLLASPRFGEHWGRHWLDLMRYAETHGSESDPEIREAWRYRDYVIRALNADVPLDQFIREQIAGDLLPKPRLGPDGIAESLLGPAQFRLVEHGFQPVDTLDDQVKAVDNQIDVVTKAFQGLTVSCARCHDHKFDAISQRDYYALYGIFASSRPAQIVIDTPEVQAKNRPELEQLHGRIKTALAESWATAAGQFGAQMRKASTPAIRPPEVNKQINHLKRQVAELNRTARQTLAARGDQASAVQDLPSPIAAWSFEKDAADAFGKLNGFLEGGAEVRDGRLILDGKGAYLRTEQLPVNLEAKTLEAWVAPTTLDQRGGGVIGVESTDVHGFDTIVFAEREPRHWLAGSNNGVRSQNVGGPAEDAKPGDLIHVAIVYLADNRIAIYRNGLPYGESYTKGEAKPFEAGKARILLGLRHKGAGNGFFAGEIEEARIYDRALTAEEVAASFQAGAVPVMTTEHLVAALSPEQREQRTALIAKIDALRTEADKADPTRDAWKKALTDAAKNSTNPLFLWAKLGASQDAAFPEAWAKLTEPLRAAIDEARKNSAANFPTRWNLAGADYAKWFPSGSGLGKEPLPMGEFSLEDQGDRILTGILPGGVATHRLSEKHNGLLTSPRFKIETDNLSVRAYGSGGAMVRVIVDNYPLPSNPIFPKANLDKDEPGWVRIDTAYRKGSMAYLEFGTYDDLTRPLRDKGIRSSGKDRVEPSHYGVDRIVFHDSKESPADENPALAALLAGDAPKTSAELAAIYERTIAAAVAAWRSGQFTELHRALLDSLVRQGVLPITLTELAPLRPLVAEYRRLEADVPELRHAPGVLETVAYDSPLLTRGDHLKPEAPVPRSYLEVFGNHPYQTAQSGRLELANAIADPKNPLTARVMANRIWSWLFGRGLVGTVDNFGRLGDKPTHPELLDFLAKRLVENGWSLKDSIRFLVTSRAFQLSSESSPAARENDPSNDWLSHMRVRRLEAEAIRDSFLSVTGRLDDQMFGKPVDLSAPRRSIYLPVRRNNLNPFLQVFDAPKPFTTLGRRDATNVPAQSLTLLNSRFVIDESTKWSQQLVRDGADDTVASRISMMFTAAFSRAPDNEELAAATAYLSVLAEDRKIPADQILKNPPVWQDFAQSLFNLKEFIYVR